MLSALFLQQLADHLKSLRVQLSLVVVAALFAASGAVYAAKFLRIADLSPIVERDVERRYDVADLNGLADSRLRLLNERLPTEFMTEGGGNWFGDSFQFEARSGGDFDYHNASRSSNHWVRRYEVVDWTFLVRLVISFLCIVLAYDTISGGRESGTLRLVLANPVPRWALVVARVGAHLCVVLSVVAVGATLSLLILSLSGMVTLTAGLAVDALLFLLGTAIYATLFLCLATGISAMARTSGASLILLVLVWAVVVVVVPQTAYLVAQQAVDLPSDWKRTLVDRVGQVTEELASQGLRPRAREEAAVDDYAVEQRWLRVVQQAEREGFAELRGRYAEALRQYRVARAVHMISPGMSFQYTAEALLRTGLGKYLHFEPQARRYRDDLRDFIRARDATDPRSPHLHFLPGFLSTAPLDADEIPRFREQRLPLGRSLELIRVPLILLLTETALALFFALWAVGRLELSRD